MKARTKGKVPEIVFRDGKAKAVILDIEEYRTLLERLEDLEDLKTLEEMRKRPLRFRKLEDFLREHQTGV
jgi:PHD/YefM family antitoxin component YafN of YafNO toxin-antitoxin module